MELTDGEFKRVEEIFQRCLPIAWTVEMFNFYLDYIRRMNNVLTGGEPARVTISQAYEFVLSVVGIDKDSQVIWSDYLDFVKSSPVRHRLGWIKAHAQADTKWKEQQKMDQTRKIYQRAICMPIENLESLWQAYNAFENDLNKTTVHLVSQATPDCPRHGNSSQRNLRVICKRAPR
jgi:cleavage stimulation factor subunit 3